MRAFHPFAGRAGRGMALMSVYLPLLVSLHRAGAAVPSTGQVRRFIPVPESGFEVHPKHNPRGGLWQYSTWDISPGRTQNVYIHIGGLLRYPLTKAEMPVASASRSICTHT